MKTRMLKQPCSIETGAPLKLRQSTGSNDNIHLRPEIDQSNFIHIHQLYKIFFTIKILSVEKSI